MRPNICVIVTDGTNCHRETAFAFMLAGGAPEIVHINELRSRARRLEDYQILAIPGGFSYGDDIASGKVLAIEFITYFGEDLKRFIEAGKLVIGICNGFQVLDRMGILPHRTFGRMEFTLAFNKQGPFLCRPVELAPEESPCVWMKGIESPITLPVAHGEGRVSASPEVLVALEREQLVPLRYAKNGVPTMEYPGNPNGSQNAIAALCDSTGRIFGLMPHPERFVLTTQYENWRREKIEKPHGLSIFENGVRFAQNL